MAGPPNAILAINSLDRFSKQGQKVDTSLLDQYFNRPPYSNSFTLQSGGAFIYGYMDKIVVSAVQLQYNCPTIVPSVLQGDPQINNSSTAGNDQMIIAYRWLESTSPDVYNVEFIQQTLPFGFYNPNELAAVMQSIILTTNLGNLCPNFTVTYNKTISDQGGFNFDVGVNSFDVGVWFPAPGSTLYIPGDLPPNPTPEQPFYNAAYNRFLRLVGMTIENSDVTQEGYTNMQSTDIISFLYTPYVDIISEVLTKFQNIKDTDSSANKLNSIIARIYLSGGGGAQTLTPDGFPLGSAPFTIVQDLNSPKIIRWSPAESVYNIDFTLRDSYGDLLFTNAKYTNDENITLEYGFSTEFQMTLLCSEKKMR